MSKYTKLLVLSKTHNLSNGSKFVSHFTTCKINGKDSYLTIRCANGVKIPYGRCIVICNEEQVDMPKYYTPYEKDGKTKYPYIYLKGWEKINEVKESKSTDVEVEFTIDPDLDDEDTPF